MKLYEAVGFQPYLTEAMILEGFLDSIKNAIGDKVDQTVQSVSNMVSALQVFYKVGMNSQYLDTATTMLKKQLRASLKGIQSGNVVKQFVDKITALIPSGSSISDFLKMCLLTSASSFLKNLLDRFNTLKKTGGEAVNLAKNEIVDHIKDIIAKFNNMDSLVGSLTQANGIFSILSGLNIANELLFKMLDYINTKIGSVKIGAGAV